MKTKKILLPGMMAALAFAACTNEEIVTMPNVTPEVDLSNRPLVGQVDLSFGAEAATRAALGEESFNKLVWEQEDRIGARLIDVPNDGTDKLRPSLNYTIDAKNAYTNYRYDFQDGASWTSEALMVEGNYMFYAPYDAEARDRGLLKMEFPLAQTLNVDGAVSDKGANASVVANFFGQDEQTYIVGHTFLSAADGGATVKPAITHLYAYPQITLKNNVYEIGEKTVEDEDGVESTVADTTYLPLTIQKIVLTSSRFAAGYKINQVNLEKVLKSALPALKYKTTQGKVGQDSVAAVSAGDWRDDITFLKDARTSYIASDTQETGADTIVITLDKPYTVQPGGVFKFHAVVPAEEYTDETLSINVVALVDGVERKVERSATISEEVATGLTFAPGKRYPTEEYNFTKDAYSVKNTAGTLATFTLNGGFVALDTPEADPEGIKTTDELITLLGKVVDNSATLTVGKKVEGAEYDYYVHPDSTLEFNQALMDEVALNLAKGELQFFDAMTIPAADLTIDNDKYTTFAGLTHKTTKDVASPKLTIKPAGKDSKTITTIDGNYVGAAADFKYVVIDGDATFSGEVTLDNVTITGDATFGGKATLTNVTINGAANFNGANNSIDATIDGHVVFNGNTTITNLVAGNAWVRSNAKVTVSGKTAMKNAHVMPGTLVINHAEYAPVKVELGYTSDQFGGNLEINANWAPESVITAESVEDNPATSANEARTVANTITVKAGMTVNFAGIDWKNATVTNNGTISSALTVPAEMKYVHGVNAAVNGTLTNNGTIENNGTLTATNNGHIKTVGTSSRTTVSGAGTVDNTELGIVINSGNTVYIETGAFSNDEKFAKLDDSHAVNSLHITGDWNVSSDLTVASSAASTTLETIVFDGGNLRLESATLDFNSVDVIFDANSTWTGRLSTVSKVTNYGDVTFNKNDDGVAYTLTTTDINMDGYAAKYVAAVQAALNAGGTVKLTEDVALTDESYLTISKDAVLDLNGFDITASKYALSVTAGKFTIKGDGTVTMSHADAAAIRTSGTAEVTIEGGKYTMTAGNNAVLAGGKSKILISGGEFSGQLYNGKSYVLNLIDNSDAQIIVNGGTFHNFNPMCSESENPAVNFLKDGATTKVTWTNPTTGAKEERENLTKPYNSTLAADCGDVVYKVNPAK